MTMRHWHTTWLNRSRDYNMKRSGTKSTRVPFGYEGDDSDLDSDKDTDSNTMAYPFLGWKNNKKPERPSPLEEKQTFI